MKLPLCDQRVGPVPRGRRVGLGAALLIVMSFAAGGVAATEENTPPKAVIEAGRTVAAACTSCHNADGIGRKAGVPHLAGQHADYMVSALQEYKTGARHDEGMKDVATKLSDDDMANVSAFFASLKPFKRLADDKTESGKEELEADPFAAVKEATAECAGCHGEDGNSEDAGTPRLAGQYEKYLIAAMKAYQSGERDDEVMKSFVESLDNADLENIAFYYAVAKPKRVAKPEAGDPFAGQAAAEPCFGCHGVDGNATDQGTPNLAGMDAEYFIATIEAYKSGARDHAVMKDYSDAMKTQEIANVAAYFATKDPKPLPIRKPLTVAEWAKRCDRCHGAGGVSTDPRFPILAGQSESYLVNALKFYHTGARSSSLMNAMSFPMGESDINKLAAHYGGKPAQ